MAPTHSDEPVSDHEGPSWVELEAQLSCADGAAAAAHLAAGRPIYYRDEQPPHPLLRKWPDGRREVVSVDDDGVVTVLGQVGP